MKLLLVLLILDCFMCIGNFCLLQNSSINSGNISNGEGNFNDEITRRISKRSLHDTTAYKEISCHKLSCGFLKFNCKCRNNWMNTDNETECIDWLWVCDGIVDCHDGEDEIDCHCSEDQFQCNPCNDRIECSFTNVMYNPYQCIPLNKKNDGIYDCANDRDETSESNIVEQECINGSFKCDGTIQCPYLNPHDEFNCSGCPSNFPISCDCYLQKEKCSTEGNVCYKESWKCNGRVGCIDGSDELGCLCKEGEFQCRCFEVDPVKCSAIHGPSFKQCILSSKYHDGNKDCLDGSDETQYQNIVQCENSNVTLRRFLDVGKYVKVVNFGCSSRELSPIICENSTCYKVSSLNCSNNDCNTTDMICTSLDTVNSSNLCRNPFQCDDGSLLLANNFCDGNYDCPDLSDEILSGPGFKCSGTLGYCVLPQRNLYDNIPQCKDHSDLNCTTECFTCLDNRLLISLKQVCDGIFDCYDLSDECLCQINVGNTFCNSLFPKNNSTINGCYNLTNINRTVFQATTKHNCLSRTKLGSRFISATLCNGQLECIDFSDECNCENPPDLCNDSCHKFYMMGDRYCDGIVDQSWKLINKSICPEGFDEANCPNRFMCKMGNYVSIDISKKCDGVMDCDNGEDEEDCKQTTLFSSNEEMIANNGLKACFWIMGVIVIGGNLYVIITSVLYFRKTRDKKDVKLQRLIVLNISIADLIMGIYMLVISVYSVVYSGSYGEIDQSWRSSLLCSIVGSLTILSSEASCLLMVLLSSFRLKQIVKPFESLTMSTKPWKVGIILVLLISTMFAILPLFHDYFVKNVWFENLFMRSSTTWDKVNITNFACRLAHLSNKTIKNNGKDWDMTKMFLKSNFPKYAPKGEFGYYGETSVCMPRFYATLGHTAWEYTLFIITLNFIAFIYIAISYAVLYKIVTQRSDVQDRVRTKEDETMHNRIARIILTDLACWIPICITSYVKIAGHYVPDIFYDYSAALLLPINSALNPFLFSLLFEKIKEKMKSCCRKDNSENIHKVNK